MENNISFVPYFPFAAGLLAGKYTPETTFPDSDLRMKKPHFQPVAFEKNLENVEKLKEIAAAKNTEVAHVVLAWYLMVDAIDVLIPGAKRSEQVISNLQALQVQLTKEEYDKIGEIFA